MTEALVKAEGGRWERPEERVWVFTNEIPDGNWGGMGQVFRLPDIAALVGGERAREAATKHLAARRRQSAQGLLDAAKEPAAV